MPLLGLNEAVNQLAIAYCVHWCDCVVEGEWSNVLDFEVKGEEGVRRGHGRSRLRGKV